MSASPSTRATQGRSRRAGLALHLLGVALIGLAVTEKAEAQSYGGRYGGGGTYMQTPGRHPGGYPGGMSRPPVPRPIPGGGYPRPPRHPYGPWAGVPSYPVPPRPSMRPPMVVDADPMDDEVVVTRPRRPRPVRRREEAERPPAVRHPPAKTKAVAARTHGEEAAPRPRQPRPGVRPEQAARPAVARRAPSPPAAPPPIALAAPRPVSGAPPSDERRYVPDEVLFTTSDASTGAAVARRLRLASISSRHVALLGASLNRYRIAGRRSVASVVRTLETDARVIQAQPNYLFTLAGDEAKGTLAAAQYAIGKVRAPEAHGRSQGDRIRIAVIDSAIDAEHREMTGAVVDSLDAVGGPAGPDAHGTAIAGIIGARADLTGIAPRAEILAVRAFAPADSRRHAVPGQAQGTTASVVTGLDWAHDKGAQVVNMSFDGPQDPLFGKAIETARAKGLILVAAAGNGGPEAKPAYPGADPNVIAVTATDPEDERYAEANRGAYVSLAAPGTEILVAAPEGSYRHSSGTSMAAAHVSGIVALVLSARPDMDVDAVRALLMRTARDLGTPGRDDDFGEGLTDALAAVTGATAAERPPEAAASPAAATGPARMEAHGTEGSDFATAAGKAP